METNTTLVAQPIDAELRELFAALLEIDAGEIGDDQDFFELGGDSLLVIKLVARVRRKLGVELTPGDVFDHANVAALSAMIARRRGD
ncbi:acyl carrier protein [Paraburkholderia sp. J67]|uniref:acyl carrier protein n=1 Tax=Paraburkholderia sp. J67 TaxID=2805435 RepID=UPI002ABE4881|nr:acyl carrier protein [Paraburkholderia sp. J67]